VGSSTTAPPVGARLLDVAATVVGANRTCPSPPGASLAATFVHQSSTTSACSTVSALVSPRFHTREPLAQLVEQQPFKVRILGNGLHQRATD
jgi:hypothetical protein